MSLYDKIFGEKPKGTWYNKTCKTCKWHEQRECPKCERAGHFLVFGTKPKNRACYKWERRN